MKIQFRIRDNVLEDEDFGEITCIYANDGNTLVASTVTKPGVYKLEAPATLAEMERLVGLDPTGNHPEMWYEFKISDRWYEGAYRWSEIMGHYE